METKDSMFVLAIVGIVAIVGVIILIMGTKASSVNSYEDSIGQAARATSPSLETGKLINAHSCNADKTCETTNLQSSGSAVVEKDLRVLNSFYLGQSYGNVQTPAVLFHEDQQDYVGVGLNLGVDGTITATGSASFENQQIELNEGTIQLQQLSGEGNAYVCINAHGVMYRSETPCNKNTNDLLTRLNNYDVTHITADIGEPLIFSCSEACNMWNGKTCVGALAWSFQVDAEGKVTTELHDMVKCDVKGEQISIMWKRQIACMCIE